MEVIGFVLGAALALVAPPFLDRAFARYFDPEDCVITWPRTIAVNLVTLLGGVVLCMPALFVPSSMGRLALCAVAPTFVHGIALRSILRLEPAAAFGTAVLVTFSVLGASLLLGLILYGFDAAPIASAVVVGVAGLVAYFIHRQGVVIRRALRAV